MGAIELMATIISVIILVKLLIILVNPKAWMNFADGLMKNTGVLYFVAIIISAVSGYYLLQVLTIVQLMASMLFFVGLFMLSLIPFYEPLFKEARKMLKDGSTIWKLFWLPILIWGALSVYTLLVLYYF